MEQLHTLIPAWQFIVFAAVFGSFWGSFANVVIARWPLEQSVWRPASHCMSCKEPIRFYDNIPIISFFTDVHDDYNRPTDDAETLNYPGMTSIARFADGCTWRCCR